MARAPRGATFVPLVRSLFPMESSNGPKLRAFLFRSAIGRLLSNSIVMVDRYWISRSRRQPAGL